MKMGFELVIKAIILTNNMGRGVRVEGKLEKEIIDSMSAITSK